MAVGSLYNVDVLSMSQTGVKKQFGPHLPVLFIIFWAYRFLVFV